MTVQTAQVTVGSQPIASKLHTLGLVLIILISASTGRIFIAGQSADALQEFGRTRIYWIALASMWFLAGYVLIGLRREVTSVRQLIDGYSWTAKRWALYLLIAFGISVSWALFGSVLGLFLRPSREDIQQLLVLLPQASDRMIWIAMSLSAGFCEELVYRGYLLRRFQQLTGRLSVGIVLQALMYGVAHAALPWQIAMSVAFLGILLGSVAAWRRTLVPGMLMHAAFDLLAGLVRR